MKTKHDDSLDEDFVRREFGCDSDSTDPSDVDLLRGDDIIGVNNTDGDLRTNIVKEVLYRQKHDGCDIPLVVELSPEKIKVAPKESSSAIPQVYPLTNGNV